MADNEPIDRGEAATIQRRDVEFLSDGVPCAAWLYTTPGAAEPRPMVIMGHGLGAVREMRLEAFAERFAAHGWSVLVFDYRHLGASGGQPRQLLDIGRQLTDWRSAVAFARTLPEVDVERIALWGTSFGGGHVLQVGSRDPHLAAIVAQCPFTDGPASLISRLRTGPLSAVALMAAGILDTACSWLGIRPILMPMAGTSWLPAFVASRDAIAGASALLPRGTLLSRRTSTLLRRLPSVRARLSENIELTAAGAREPATKVGRDSMWGVLRGPDNDFDAANALAARLVLRLPLYRPGRAMANSSIPTLLCVCDNDAAAPAKTTKLRARGLAHVRVETYPCDHFDIYLGTYYEDAVRDQIDFLTKQFANAAHAAT
ncbi:Alpha/beta hydrolase family protein [Nocardia amikacinitolerans]|uniref:Alpha/beta hydrolase family protein n=1 Tax=Nocardia amikacinitolerans TaxID=756689 RepID=A0A285LSD1_9NOCA|nr:alpha/beta fold hydrolase [Nocardia amikacinitolerans]MCP2295729.1 Alpha/beta hydrolase family protein [Nocardia amikacinitolerans]SNY87830.1 Alpha/beta hydrolase family protein [Nocardia amikacinitolerans]